MAPILQVIDLFLTALWLMIIVYVLGSWLPSIQRSSWFLTIRQIVEPLLRPFRRILPPQNLGGLDLSPIFLVILLSLIQHAVRSQLRGV